MRVKTRHIVPVVLFVIFAILRGAELPAQTPSATSPAPATTTASNVTTNG